MARINIRTKGQNGEREAARLLQEFAGPVAAHCGVPVPKFERNILQSRQGGYDLVGVDWLALEVKRQELEYNPAWWDQVRRAAGPGQEPVLMWRQNRRPWRFKLTLWSQVGRKKVPIEAVLDETNFKSWFQFRLFAEWTRATEHNPQPRQDR